MRPTWNGFLKISLVTIPIRVYPATEAAATLSFNQLHAACGTRIQQKRWCPRCETELANSELVKGYEFERGKYVVLEPADFDAVQVPSTRVIDLVQFTPADALDPMYVDRTYYLAPDGDMAASAFAVMAHGMVGHIGIGKLALYGREYLVAVRSVVAPALGRRTLVCYTLHHAGELRPVSAIADLAAVPAVVDVGQVKLARQVIAAFDRPLDLTLFTDAYQEQLRAVLDAKIAGQPPAIAPLDPVKPIPNLLDALKSSLATVSAAKKPSAKATREKKRRTA